MNDMNMQLRTDTGKCLYEQIYEHIRKEIREGRLLQGEKLPATRALAEYLQVSRSTVDNAYEQLLSEGYIESRPCRGYFVCKVEELYRLPENENRPEKRKAPECRKKENWKCDFSPYGIDRNSFPFSVWNRICRNTLSEGAGRFFTSGNPQGEEELRNTISRYLHASRGVNCTPEQIIIGAGNDYLLMLLEKILGRNIKIAMENPTYKRAFRIFESFSYDICTLDMDESGIRIEDLEESQATVAYVMPSHQFPTGVVMPIGRRMELLRWAEKGQERYLIEDDYDSEFRYRGKPIPSLQGSDRAGKVIYMGTFSKAIAPSIRISFMVLPEKLLKIYQEKCFFYSSTVSRIDQMVLNDFIEKGYFERHLNKMRKVYKTKHDKMLSLLKPFKSSFLITGENAGLHLLLQCKDGRTESMLVKEAEKRGVKVYGISDGYVSGQIQKKDSMWSKNAILLLGYGGLSEEEMKAGVENLKKAWLES